MAITHPRAGGAGTARGWVEGAARAGHLTKGVLYLLIGALAIRAVVGEPGEGAIGGPRTAVDTIAAQPFGQLLLTLVGVGLFAYAAWRIVQALLDPEAQAREGGKGVAKRIGWGISGVLHAAIGVAALQMARGERASAGSEGGSTWIGQVLALPAGQAIVIAAGIAVVLFGLYEIVRAFRTDFARKLDLSRAGRTERVWSIRAGRIGYLARGVVFLVVGAGIVRAGMEARPGEAQGVGGALREIACQPWGAALLVIVATGLVAYGAFEILASRSAGRHARV